jgi:hypothetical protein
VSGQPPASGQRPASSPAVRPLVGAACVTAGLVAVGNGAALAETGVVVIGHALRDDGPVFRPSGTTGARYLLAGCLLLVASVLFFHLAMTSIRQGVRSEGARSDRQLGASVSDSPDPPSEAVDGPA